MSPSLLLLIPRITSQFQFSRPREIQADKTLRFWFAMVLVFNIGSVWTHAVDGASTGPSLILDFVGMGACTYVSTIYTANSRAGYVPSKLQLVFLDVFIIFLEMVLTTIAYETSLSAATSATDTTDTLLHVPRSPNPQLSTPNKSQPINVPYYALDLQFGAIIKRLRGPAPAATRDLDRDELLPLPNTVPAGLRESLGVLLRARADLRTRANPPPPTATPPRAVQSTTRTVPGAMDND